MADGLNFSLKGFDQYEVLLGDELRGERATMGKSLLDVQRDLKIKAAYIAAIENCDLEAFTNRGFVAGYVRSYARYLQMDPDDVYERFCLESGYLKFDREESFDIRNKKSKKTKKHFGEDSNWKPSPLGFYSENRSNIIGFTSRLLPILCLLFVIFGVSFGAFEVLKDVQRLDIVGIEDAPVIATESQVFPEDKIEPKYDMNLYMSQDLTLPVVSPRDGPISELKPELVTALENKPSEPINVFKHIEDFQADDELEDNSYRDYPSPDPIVRTSPKLPDLKLFALTPAWVRLTNGDGIVVFEKILAANESHKIEKELFNGLLRAGNATNVYFLLENQALGPISEVKSVAKKISLNPEVIKSKWTFSETVTSIYLAGENRQILVDTAKKQD